MYVYVWVNPSVVHLKHTALQINYTSIFKEASKAIIAIQKKKRNTCNKDVSKSATCGYIENSVKTVNGSDTHVAMHVEKFKSIFVIKLCLVTILICCVENSIISFNGIYTYSANHVKNV